VIVCIPPRQITNLSEAGPGTPGWVRLWAYWGFERLGAVRPSRPGRRRLNRLDDIHSPDDAAEGGESLAIRVAPPAEIHLRLIADDDRKRTCGRVGPGARHRQRAVDVLEAGHARALQRNGRKLVAPARRVDLELNDLDLDVVPHRVVRPHR